MTVPVDFWVAAATRLVSREPWMQDAACVGTADPDAWFPADNDVSQSAQAVCAVCPVVAECAEYGLGERWGIYGGLTGAQRDRIRRGRPAHSQAGLCVTCGRRFLRLSIHRAQKHPEMGAS